MKSEITTWTLVAYIGIIGHDMASVSLAAPHFINGCIKEIKKLSINLVSEEILPEADYVGFISGVKQISPLCLNMNLWKRERRSSANLR